jgi:hypothetical protein
MTPSDNSYASLFKTCPKVSNMISRELIWQEVRSEKTLDSQGFYAVSRSGETGRTELAIWCLRPLLSARDAIVQHRFWSRQLGARPQSMLTQILRARR